MKPTYHQYRSYGHTKFASAVLAVPFWSLLIGATVVGLVIGVIVVILR